MLPEDYRRCPAWRQCLRKIIGVVQPGDSAYGKLSALSSPRTVLTENYWRCPTRYRIKRIYNKNDTMKRIFIPIAALLLAACSATTEKEQPQEISKPEVEPVVAAADSLQVDAVTSATAMPNLPLMGK